MHGGCVGAPVGSVAIVAPVLAPQQRRIAAGRLRASDPLPAQRLLSDAPPTGRRTKTGRWVVLSAQRRCRRCLLGEHRAHAAPPARAAAVRLPRTHLPPLTRRAVHRSLPRQALPWDAWHEHRLVRRGHAIIPGQPVSPRLDFVRLDELRLSERILMTAQHRHAHTCQTRRGGRGGASPWAVAASVRTHHADANVRWNAQPARPHWRLGVRRWLRLLGLAALRHQHAELGTPSRPRQSPIAGVSSRTLAAPHAQPAVTAQQFPNQPAPQSSISQSSERSRCVPSSPATLLVPQPLSAPQPPPPRPV